MKDSEYLKQVTKLEKKLVEQAMKKYSDIEIVSTYETFVNTQKALYGDNANFSTMSIKEKTIHGWNKGYLYYTESLLNGRYNYLFNLIHLKEQGKKKAILDSAIPQLSFSKNRLTIEMLKKCLDCRYTNHFDNQKKLSLFIQWILYSFKSNEVKELPKEITDDLNNYWYKEFRLQLLLAYPYDYFGELAQEYGIGKGGSYFATPHTVSQAMAEITFNDKPITKFSPVCDPCGGSGRLLLFASNKSLSLFYQDINKTLCNICAINAYLYMPCMNYGDLISDLKTFVNAKDLNGFDWKLARDILKNKKVG